MIWELALNATVGMKRIFFYYYGTGSSSNLCWSFHFNVIEGYVAAVFTLNSPNISLY